MPKELDVIIVDDDPSICKMISNIIKSFYIWGEVISFTDIDEAIAYCTGRDMGVAVFVLDVYLGEKSGFDFLDQIVERFPSAREDTIINAQPHRYDLVITDMTMPNMTGEKLAVELIRIRPDIPIILCTGYGETLLGERLKNIGIKTLVMKPVLRTELAKAIQNALDNK